MKGMELIPLGTNGFFSTGGRQTMSFLALDGETAVLLDAGTGVGRLLEGQLASRIAGCGRLEIFLSHYHLDHVAGLAFLSAVWGGGPVRILAPGPPLVDGDPSALDRLVAPPLFPKGLSDLSFPVEIRPYTEDLELAGRPARVRRQDHGGGSVGLRWNGLAYCTDCRVDGGSAPFVRGSDLLIHEVWVTDEEAEDGANRDGHSTVGEVADLAAEAGIRRLLPVHHRPGRTDEELARIRTLLADRSGIEVLATGEGEALEV